MVHTGMRKDIDMYFLHVINNKIYKLIFSPNVGTLKN